MADKIIPLGAATIGQVVEVDGVCYIVEEETPDSPNVSVSAVFETCEACEAPSATEISSTVPEEISSAVEEASSAVGPTPDISSNVPEEVSSATQGISSAVGPTPDISSNVPEEVSSATQGISSAVEEISSPQPEEISSAAAEISSGEESSCEDVYLFLEPSNAEISSSEPAPAAMAMYATDGSNLYKVDVSSGSRTLIGAHGMSLRSLGWDPRTQTMYASQQGFDTNNVCTVDLSTGAATVIGLTTATDAPMGDWAMNPDDTEMFAMAYNSVFQTNVPSLTGWTFKTSTPGSDPGSGLGTEPGGQSYIVRSNGIWPIDLDAGTLGTEVSLSGAATTGRALQYMDGTWYMLSLDGGAGSGKFCKVNPTTGVITAISSNGTWFGIALAPGEAPPEESLSEISLPEISSAEPLPLAPASCPGGLSGNYELENYTDGDLTACVGCTDNAGTPWDGLLIDTGGCDYYTDTGDGYAAIDGKAFNYAYLDLTTGPNRWRLRIYCDTGAVWLGEKLTGLDPSGVYDYVGGACDLTPTITVVHV